MFDAADRNRVRRRFAVRRDVRGWQIAADRARHRRRLPLSHIIAGGRAGTARRPHRHTTRIHWLPLVLIALTACGPQAEPPHYPNLTSPGESTSESAPESSPGVDVVPTAVRIPSIGVNNNQMMQVGLNPDHSLEVPPLSAPKLIAWFKLGPLPGESALCPFSAGCVQPAVLNSHVNGDGVQGGFAKLSNLKVGATVEVDRSDKRTASFTVTKVMVFKKTAFDTKSVYGVAGPSLVLVTCGPGQVINGSYVNQTVVIAKLTSLKPTGP